MEYNRSTESADQTVHTECWRDFLGMLGCCDVWDVEENANNDQQIHKAIIADPSQLEEVHRYVLSVQQVLSIYNRYVFFIILRNVFLTRFDVCWGATEFSFFSLMTSSWKRQLSGCVIIFVEHVYPMSR